MSVMRKHQRVVRGHSLLELVLSLVLLGIIASSVGSAVMFASSASPDEDSFEVTIAIDSRVISQIAEDLAVAKYVIEREKGSVTIVVADRTGDGNPDRVRYAWSGAAGDPLTYQLNENNAYNLIDSVETFELVYVITEKSAPLPVATYYDDETLIDQYDETGSSTERGIKYASPAGQIVTPALSDDSLGFKPTRIAYYSSYKTPTDGEFLIELRDRAGNVPGTTVYGSNTSFESTLTASENWNSFMLSQPAFVSNDQDIAIVTSYVSGSNEVFQIGEKSVSGGLLGLGGGNGGLIYSWDRGSTWNIDNNKTHLYRVYGRELLPDSDQYSTERQHLTRVQITLQGPAEDRSPLVRNIRMLLAPPYLTDFAETGFGIDPTSMDLDADGRADWVHTAGTFPGSSISNGIWTCNGELTYTSEELAAAKVINITARMRSNDTLGPAIHLSYIDTVLGDKVIPVIVQLRASDSGGQELAIYNDLTMNDELTIVRDLPAGLLDIGVKFIPHEEYLYVEVNHQPAVAMLLDRIDNPETFEQGVTFKSSGGVAEFGSITIRLDDAYSHQSVDDNSGLIPGLLDLLF